MKTAVIYTRSRCENPTNTREKTFEQIQALHFYSLENSIRIVAKFQDEGAGANDLYRLGYRDLWNYLNAHEVDYLLFTSWDRMSRDFIHLEQTRIYLKNRRITPIAIHQQRTPSSGQLLTIL